MIIFGTRGIHTTRERGHFHCPQCGAQQPFRKRRVRSFFHIYFIPLIPISGGTEYIKCDACKGDFQLGVLDYDPQKVADEIDAAFKTAVTSTIVAMVAADGEIEPEEVSRACELVAGVLKIELTPAEVEAQAREALDGHVPVDAALRNVAPHINEHGKELIVRVAADIAAADGDFAGAEMDLIVRIAGNLGMSEAHVRGILMGTPAKRNDEAYDME